MWRLKSNVHAALRWIQICVIQERLSKLFIPSERYTTDISIELHSQEHLNAIFLHMRHTWDNCIGAMHDDGQAKVWSVPTKQNISIWVSIGRRDDPHDSS
jgi:hypothetical protein